MTIRSKIDAAYALHAQAEKALEDARQECAHPSYKVGLYSWRIGATEIAKICSDCDHPLGEPSLEERNAFKREEQANQERFLRETYGEEVAERILTEVRAADRCFQGR